MKILSLTAKKKKKLTKTGVKKLCVVKCYKVLKFCLEKRFLLSKKTRKMVECAGTKTGTGTKHRHRHRHLRTYRHPAPAPGCRLGNDRHRHRHRHLKPAPAPAPGCRLSNDRHRHRHLQTRTGNRHPGAGWVTTGTGTGTGTSETGTRCRCRIGNRHLQSNRAMASRMVNRVQGNLSKSPRRVGFLFHFLTEAR